MAGTHCNSTFDNRFLLNLDYLSGRFEINSSEIGIAFMVPPFYDGYGRLTIGLIASNNTDVYTFDGSSTDIYIVVGTSARSWNLQMADTLDELDGTEVAVTDRLGNVYATYPKDYMEQRCPDSGSWKHFDAAKVTYLG